LREEANEVNFVGGQSARGQPGDESAWAGDGFDATARIESRANDTLPGIADARSAGIRDERHFLALLEALDELFAALCFVEFEIAQEGLFDIEILEQVSGVAGVLGGDDVAFAQGAEGAQGDVFEIADRSRDQIQRSGDERWHLLFFTHAAKETASSEAWKG
jgi:hypothetical protein